MTDVDAVAGKVVEELGVTLATLTTALGVRTGMWAALAGAGPLTAQELAERTGTAPALAREWCRTQAAGGYLRLDGERGERYVLPDEVAAVLVHGPMGALVDAATTMLTATAVRFDAFTEAFASGRGSAGRSARTSTGTAWTGSPGPRWPRSSSRRPSRAVAWGTRCGPVGRCSTSGAARARPR